MSSALKSIRDHFIVCGCGRMGQTICRHLAERGIPFVVVDRDSGVMADCEQVGWPYVCDDATSDRTLLDAGIERARGLAAVLDNDSDNLFVVVSARLIASELRIIARAADESTARKMERAGANRVVSLYTAGAATMAQLLINPHVGDFFEIVAGGATLDVAEIRVTPESPYAHQTLAATDFRERGVIIVAIRRPDGESLIPPPSDQMIQPGDELIAFGKVDAVSQFLAEE